MTTTLGPRGEETSMLEGSLSISWGTSNITQFSSHDTCAICLSSSYRNGWSSCPFANSIWQSCIAHFNLTYMPRSLVELRSLDLCNHLATPLRIKWDNTMHATIWIICQERNSRIFNGWQLDDASLCDAIELFVELWPGTRDAPLGHSSLLAPL